MSSLTSPALPATLSDKEIAELAEAAEAAKASLGACRSKIANLKAKYA